MLVLPSSIRRALMVVIKDILLFYFLNVFKRFVINYLIRSIQDKDDNAGLLFDARQLTDKSSAAVFIVA